MLEASVSSADARGAETESRRGGIGAAHVDHVVRGAADADLDRDRGAGAIEELDAVELGAGRDPVDLADELLELGVEGRTVVTVERPVGGLHGQLTHAAEDVAHLTESALGGLDEETPSWALRDATEKERMSARMRSEIPRPAASSAAEAIRRPEESRAKLLLSAVDELKRFRCAFMDATFVLTRSPIRVYRLVEMECVVNERCRSLPATWAP